MNRLYKISEIREKLGSLTMFMLSNDFQNKYSSVRNSPNDFAQIVFDNESNTDKFVADISQVLLDNVVITKLIATASNSTVFTIFFRYHNLTMYLVEQDQSSVINLPSSDSEFFVELLQKVWIKGL